jgi:hypothetical protein
METDVHIVPDEVVISVRANSSANEVHLLGGAEHAMNSRIKDASPEPTRL